MSTHAQDPGTAAPAEERIVAIMTLDTALTCVAGDLMVVKEDGIRKTIAVPATADLQYGTFCVCLAAQATAAGDVLCCFAGNDLDIKVEGTTAIALTDPLIASNGNRDLRDGAAATGAQKVLGWITTAYSTGAVAVKKVRAFNGITGFGAVT